MDYNARLLEIFAGAKDINERRRNVAGLLKEFGISSIERNRVRKSSLSYLQGIISQGRVPEKQEKKVHPGYKYKTPDVILSTNYAYDCTFNLFSEDDLDEPEAEPLDTVTIRIVSSKPLSRRTIAGIMEKQFYPKFEQSALKVGRKSLVITPYKRSSGQKAVYDERKQNKLKEKA